MSRVCLHNALRNSSEHLRACATSIFDQTNWPFSKFLENSRKYPYRQLKIGIYWLLKSRVVSFRVFFSWNWNRGQISFVDAPQEIVMFILYCTMFSVDLEQTYEQTGSHFTSEVKRLKTSVALGTLSLDSVVLWRRIALDLDVFCELKINFWFKILPVTASTNLLYHCNLESKPFYPV